MREVFPTCNRMTSNFYDTKKHITALGLPVEKINCCLNGCMVYWGPTLSITQYEVCVVSRWIIDKAISRYQPQPQTHSSRHQRQPQTHSQPTLGLEDHFWRSEFIGRISLLLWLHCTLCDINLRHQTPLLLHRDRRSQIKKLPPQRSTHDHHSHGCIILLNTFYYLFFRSQVY